MENLFLSIQDWIPDVLESVKKDLKADHLSADARFAKTHFGSRPLNRLSNEEILKAYEKELLNNYEGLAEFVVNRWVFKHGDLYNHFAERLGQINPDFSAIDSLTEEESEQILLGASEKFGEIPVFLFSMLNGVVFPEKIKLALRSAAEKAKREREREKEVADREQSLEQILASHQREIARMQDKILGVQKKYSTDMEALKKQIRSLQKQLHGR